MTTPKRTFQGDPRMILGENGSTIKFVGGQPIMDAGLENYILHRLFVKKDWPGNYLFSNLDEQYGSDFEDKLSGAITLDGITDAEKAGEKALAKLVETGLAESVSVEIFNPTGDNLTVYITVKRPNEEAQTVALSRTNLIWQSQTDDPAHRKL
jgi:phage gp46-like protein